MIEGARRGVPFVVTGFGPFGVVRDNPSGPFARAVADALSARGHDARALVWDTTFERAKAGPRELVAATPGAFLLHTGVAAKRPRASIELCARNVRGGSGEVTRATTPLEPGAPDERVTRVDVDAVLAHLDPRDWERSTDAGDFVCNATYFSSLEVTGGRSLFVHVPAVVAAGLGAAFVEALLRVVPST